MPFLNLGVLLQAKSRVRADFSLKEFRTVLQGKEDDKEEQQQEQEQKES